MYHLSKSHLANRAADIAVVEIRTNVTGGIGFDKRAEQLLAGTFKDAGLSYNKVARYSLTFAGGAVTAEGRRALYEELAKHDFELIVTLGAEPLKSFCNTKKTLDSYSGSLTWNERLGKWILPTFHPSVVYVGPKETINGRYDKFDFMYDHIDRAVELVTGTKQFPPTTGHNVPWEFIGSNGDKGGSWTGYKEAKVSEVHRAEDIFTDWLGLLDTDRLYEGIQTRKFAIDTESCNLNTFDPMLMLQVYDGEKAYAFNFGVLNEIRGLVQRFLNHPNARWIIHNTKYDRQVLKRWFDVDLGDRDVDTMMLALGTTEKGKQCGLKYLSRQHLNAPFYEEELEAWLDQANINYSHIRPDVLAEYGCKDVYYTYHLFPILLEKVKKEGTEKLVRSILMPAQRTLGDVEYQGMQVDLDYAKTTSAAWEPKIDAAIKVVQEYAREQGFPLDSNTTGGQSYKSVCQCVPVRAQFHLEGKRVLSYAKALRENNFVLDDCTNCNNKRYRTFVDNTLNVNSSTQMQHLCFDILGMKELPSEGRKCNKAFWKFNANHSFAQLVADYKELQYLRRNFLDGVQRFVAEDGKVHPDFLLFGTKTGRLAIHNPAMQTVPQHGENARAAKRLFVADDTDSLIVNVDYKSLEMFMAHHLTGDPVLLENLLGEWDVHTALAAKVYAKNPNDVSPVERQSVKSVNFGAGYGISGFKLALDPAMEQATGGDPDVAQSFIDAFWSMYSVWRNKCDEWRAQAHDVQYLTTELGRKRRWNLITGDNKNKVNNQAINFPGQSMASDLCLSSLISLHWELQGYGWGRVLLTVHDSLVFNIKREFLHEAVALIIKRMTTPPFKTETPFAVDVEVGVSYGDKEPYDSERDYVSM